MPPPSAPPPRARVPHFHPTPPGGRPHSRPPAAHVRAGAKDPRAARTRGRRGSAALRGQPRAQQAASPTPPTPRLPLPPSPPHPEAPQRRGAGCAQVCGAMPCAEPTRGPGGRGAMIDRPNSRLISYLRPRALIGCALTSSDPAAPRWAGEGGGRGRRCAPDKPESHFQPQVDFVPTIGGVAAPLHGCGQTSSSAPLLMEPHLLRLLLGLLLGGTRALAGYPIWW